MPYRIACHRDTGDEGTQWFASEVEAREAARSIEGVALLMQEPSGSLSVFRHGLELQGAEASDAVALFGHQIEVGVSRAGEPDTNIDPDDSTGSGFRPGSADVYGWRVWKGTPGPKPWIGTFATPEAALADAEEARDSDPELAGLPIVPIYPSPL